jgi:NitT/TauT family transport system substrate-binding protein
MKRLGGVLSPSGPLPSGLLCMILAVAAAADEGGLARATFLPQWTPQAQFAGYYVADEKGFYRQRGLDLAILTGGPDHPPSQFLADGEADFVTLWLSTAIQMRARGIPVVNIGQGVQRSALMLVAKRSSGIRTPADLDGKKVAVWDGDFRLQPEAFFKRFGLKVQIVPLGSSVNLLLRDGVIASTAMWYNEYYALLNAGLDPNEITTFFFDAYDLNFPEDGLYCLATTLEQRPAVVQAFVEASWQGWQEAFAHPEAAVDTVMRYMAAAHVPANRVHQRWMLARMRDLMVRRDGDPYPAKVLERGEYERVARLLLENGWIERIPPFQSFYRPPGS